MKTYVKCWKCESLGEAEPRSGAFGQQAANAYSVSLPDGWTYFKPPCFEYEPLCSACSKKWEAHLANAIGAFARSEPRRA